VTSETGPSAHSFLAALADTLAGDFDIDGFLRDFVAGCVGVLGVDAVAVRLDGQQGAPAAEAAAAGPGYADIPEQTYRNAEVHALPMRLRGRTLGTLTLLSASPGRLDPDTLALAKALVGVVTVGLLHERTIRRQNERTDQLENALGSRILIEQAKGILAERLAVSVEEAFALLRRHARNHNRRLHDCARDVVDGSLRIAADPARQQLSE
jgi:hypothetical protein